VQIAKSDTKDAETGPPNDTRDKSPAAHSQPSSTACCPIGEFDHEMPMLRGQPDPHSMIIRPFARKADATALMRTRPVDPPRRVPGTRVGWWLKQNLEGALD
jgi:hypothetical protein